MDDLIIELQLPEGGTDRRSLPEGVITIGRGKTCEIAVADPLLSRRHAELERRGALLTVRDLGSRNGTFVNGVRLDGAVQLQTGDVLQLGGTVVHFGPRTESGVVFSDSDLSTHGKTVMFDARELLQKSGEVEQPTAVRHLQALVEASRSLVGHVPQEELMERLLALIRSQIPSDRVALVLVEDREGVLQPRLVRQLGDGGGEFVLSRTLAEQVIQGRQTVLIRDVFLDTALAQAQSLILQGVRSILCAPLLSEDKVLGLLYLDTNSHQGFGSEETRLLTALANLAALKLENLRLVEAALERKALEAELEAAAKVQLHLLPHDDPEIPGYDIHGQLKMFYGVGGDYFDWHLGVNGILSGVVADVSGKGMGAALIMATFQSAWRALTLTEQSLEVAAQQLNQILLERTPPERFVTAIMFQLEPASGAFRYVRAGHEPPLLSRGDAVEELSAKGLPLGMLPKRTYSCSSIQLEEGDILLLYTDGASEQPNRIDELFGRERLAQALLQLRHLRSHEIAGGLQLELERFAAGQDPTDDITMMLIRRGADIPSDTAAIG